MITNEIIDGNTVQIAWDFIEIVERHDSNWCMWKIIGEGDNEVRYIANCFADKNHPEDTWDEIRDIDIL